MSDVRTGLPSGTTRELLLDFAADLGRELAASPDEPRYYYGKPTRRGLLMDALDGISYFLAEDGVGEGTDT
jgi:hypothetical protein